MATQLARVEQQRRQIMKLQWAECSKTAFSGDFTPVLVKHTKHLSLVDVFSIGVDRIQRNFEPMKKQVEAWKATRIPDEAAKLVIYRAFVESELDWMFPNISPAAFMIFISIHRSKNSLRGRQESLQCLHERIQRA